MPKKRKEKEVIEMEEPIMEEEIIEEEQPQVEIKKETPKEVDTDDIPDELQNIIDTCGADTSYTVNVFRYNPKTQIKEKVGAYQIMDFLPDQIAKMYGGGKYEYHIRVGNKLFRRLTTTYATAIVPEKPQAPTLQEIQNMINNTNKDDNSNNAMLEFIKLQQAQNTALLTAIMQNNQNNKNDDSFDKLVKLMTVMGVKNPNSDIDKLLSVFERGLNLSTKVNDLQDEEDEDTGLIGKLLKGLMKEGIGTDVLQKLLAGKNNGNIVEQAPIENPPETLIQPQQSQPIEQPITSNDIVLHFLNKHKKRILIEYNSKTEIDDLADFYYNGILIDDELINAFTEVFLSDISPIINQIAEFNEPNINQYIKSVLEKIKDLLYNSNTETNIEENGADNVVSTQEDTGK